LLRVWLICSAHCLLHANVFWRNSAVVGPFARGMLETKIKVVHSRNERRVLELIPVLGSHPAGDRSHKPGSRLPLLSARPAVTSPAAEHHRPLAGTKLYCLVTEAHVQLAQGCTRQRGGRDSNFEPATC